MNATAITGYGRVSTSRQVEGLSLTYQTESIKRYAEQRGLPVTNIYVESESGRNHKNRPKFLAALAECKRTGNILVCTRLDRLSRCAWFLMALKDVSFHCIEQPDLSSPMVLSLLAALSQNESETIGSRVRSSLRLMKEQAAKDGVPFFEGQRRALARVRGRSLEVIKQNALARRQERLPGIRGIFETTGERNFTKTAQILTSLQVPTVTGRGNGWTPTGVRRLMIG